MNSGRDFGNFQILAGETVLTEGTLIPVTQVIEHPAYNDWTLENDVVILKISQRLVFSDRIRPIPLPTPNFQVAPNRPTTLAGWGTLQWGVSSYPDVLQAVVKPTLSNEECQKIYDEEDILETHICSGEYGRDACQGKLIKIAIDFTANFRLLGDSGGPLVYNGIHVGIVSWGYYCAQNYVSRNQNRSSAKITTIYFLTLNSRQSTLVFHPSLGSFSLTHNSFHDRRNTVKL